MATQTGKVVQVIGAVVDFEFFSQQLPAINNAIIIKDDADLVIKIVRRVCLSPALRLLTGFPHRIGNVGMRPHSRSARHSLGRHRQE